MTKPRILVVDDQPVLARMLRLMLEKTGQFDVREVTLSQHAAQAARIFQPDIVVLDMEMPGKNGAEIAHELTRSNAVPSSSIIFFSGLIAKYESGMKPTPNGPMRFLSKAEGPEQSVRVIREALACRNATPAVAPVVAAA